jgi:transposase
VFAKAWYLFGMNPQQRHALTDDQWETLAPLLPPQRPKTGRPARDHRTVLGGILWVLRSGAPWRDLPACYGPWQTAYSRFRRWREAGVWDRVLAALQADAAHDGTLDDTLAIIDGTSIRAHHQAAGAKKGAPPNSGGAAAAGGASCT